MIEQEQKIIAPWIADVHRLISYWPRNLSGNFLNPHNSQPFNLLTALKYLNFGGLSGALKTDFEDSKDKSGYSSMDFSSFLGKNQNSNKSFSVYQITAYFID